LEKIYEFYIIGFGVRKTLSFNANVWNWKPTLEIIKSFDILSEGKMQTDELQRDGRENFPRRSALIGEKIATKFCRN
jgi:hypothetical protein